MTQPLDDLHRLAQIARPDHGRAERTGMPEVVLAEGKTTAQCLTIARELLERAGRALVSRVSSEQYAALQRYFSEQGYLVEESPAGTTVIIRQTNHEIALSGGQVGILTAGTADIPVAEEAALVCGELGCSVQSAYDVGVAGLHRLHEPLAAMLHTTPVDVLVVAAGMDGALPSVVAGLTAVPVIGLPTSTGYGMGGHGNAALMSMLQTCVPGLAVVNIDNGIGAGALAARIANQMAAARQNGSE